MYFNFCVVRGCVINFLLNDNDDDDANNYNCIALHCIVFIAVIHAFNKKFQSTTSNKKILFLNMQTCEKSLMVCP